MCSSYIEIDSTYRNRNEWPLPSEFDVLLSQTGRKSNTHAVDPISKSSCELTWQSNVFNATTNSYTVDGTVLDIIPRAGRDRVGALTSQNFYILVGNATNGFQIDYNYYKGASLVFSSKKESARIIEYKWIGTTQTGNFDIVSVSTDIGLTSVTSGDILTISDPTDITANTKAPIFVPRGNDGDNKFINKYLYNITHSVAIGSNSYRVITHFDDETQTLKIDTTQPVNAIWNNTDQFCIREELPILSGVLNNTASSNIICLDVNLHLPPIKSWVTIHNGLNQETSLITNTIQNIGIARGGSTNTVVLNIQASNVSNYYGGSYIQINSGAASGDIREITAYDASTQTVTVNAVFTGVGVVVGDNYSINCIKTNSLTTPVNNTNTVSILPFSYDNLNPLNYSGSQLLHQQFRNFEIYLCSLIIPNRYLKNNDGKRIVNYPYIYVELSNNNFVNMNAIYSNNPNSLKMLFKVPTDDTTDIEKTSFVKLECKHMVQNIKFKPNDNLHFSVRTPNGKLLEFVDDEFYGPNAPNSDIQISALFRLVEK